MSDAVLNKDVLETLAMGGVAHCGEETFARLVAQAHLALPPNNTEASKLATELESIVSDDDYALYANDRRTFLRAAELLRALPPKLEREEVRQAVLDGIASWTVPDLLADSITERVLSVVKGPPDG